MYNFFGCGFGFVLFSDVVVSWGIFLGRLLLFLSGVSPRAFVVIKNSRQKKKNPLNKESCNRIIVWGGGRGCKILYCQLLLFVVQKQNSDLRMPIIGLYIALSCRAVLWYTNTVFFVFASVLLSGCVCSAVCPRYAPRVVFCLLFG